MSTPSQRNAGTPSSIIFQSSLHNRSVVLLDIPRSLEEAQVPPGQQPPRRVYCRPPPRDPFPTPDPRRHGRRRRGSRAPDWPAQAPAAQINDLMTAASVRSALLFLRDNHPGPYHLPRVCAPDNQDNQDDPGNSTTIPVPNATALHGSIAQLGREFLETAPAFKLVVLDPPWPNRSARRRAGNYATVMNLAEMKALLTSIPIAARLASDGLVAVWITNKTDIPELLTRPGGVFASWGVELVCEWTWLKITSLGEPVFDVDSTWRKPWEKMLVAKRIGAPAPALLRPKVIVAAPDVHSRKPSLRGLFEEILGESYPALEVFARNLTAGWWSWGDQVLQFQGERDRKSVV